METAYPENAIRSVGDQAGRLQAITEAYLESIESVIRLSAFEDDLPVPPDLQAIRSAAISIVSGLDVIKRLLLEWDQAAAKGQAADPETILRAMDAEMDRIDKNMAAVIPQTWSGASGSYEELMRSCHRLKKSYAGLRKLPARDCSGAFGGVPGEPSAVSSEAELIWQTDVPAEGRKKSIRFLCGDILGGNSPCDVLVCSAYKNGYAPAPDSLIGELLADGISVAALSREKEIDLAQMGAWLSRKIDGRISRIAMTELSDYGGGITKEQTENACLKSAFTTLRFLLEQAALRGIEVKRIAMPVLGTGQQKIGLNYVAVPLLKQCLLALHSVPGLEVIDICDKDPDKMESLVSHMKSILLRSPDFIPRVFISYSSRQKALADRICGFLRSNGISCWMAPDSVPEGSDYTQEIPVALSNVKAVLLVLTEDAMNSVWVRKEVSAAIGAGAAILPVQVSEFCLNMQFRFLLEGEQIMNVCGKSAEEYLPRILEAIGAVIA